MSVVSPFFSVKKHVYPYDNVSAHFLASEFGWHRLDRALLAGVGQTPRGALTLNSLSHKQVAELVKPLGVLAQLGTLLVNAIMNHAT